MGRKRDRRIAEIDDEYRNAIDEAAATEHIADQPDQELFSIDRSGGGFSRKKTKVVDTVNVKENIVSATEAKLVSRISSKLKNIVPTASRNQNKKLELTDLWADEKDIGHKNIFTSTGNSRKSVSLPLPGQSYNPSCSDHTSAIARAAKSALKIKALADTVPASALVEAGLTLAAVKDVESALVLPASKEDLVSLQQQASPAPATTQRPQQQVTSKPIEKLTRAQRNKIRARNEREVEQQKLKAEKALRRGIDQLPVILKEARKAERLKAEALAAIAAKRESEKSDALLPPEDVSAVPLSDELHGSLRQLVPKGRPTIERVAKMRAAGKMMSEDRRTRRAYEKPHGSKKIVWTPKYKVHHL